jgi:hypothetical protein
MNKNSAVAARLCEEFGCFACKAAVTEDDFLLSHERFWCQKRKESFSKDQKAHKDCPSWIFNGDEGLLKQAEDGQPGLPFEK